MIVKARPLASGIAHKGIEMYTVGRFFTMTGRAPEEARPIVAAPDAFAVLAEELRAQIASSRDRRRRSADRAVNGRTTSKQQTPRPMHGFRKLPPEKQSEVVKYAALHIAKNSKLFELTGNGGNYQEYLKLALALARSGVAEAEDIFVAGGFDRKGCGRR